MKKAFLGLGSNVGDRLRNLRFALHSLQIAGVEMQGASPVYATEPVGCRDQDVFLNVALEVGTSLEPRELLELCRETEDRAGRERGVHHGPRTLDIDILFYEDVVLKEPLLMIPHPRMTERRFVLEPLARLGANFPDGTPAVEALEKCADKSFVDYAGTLVALGDPREVPLAFIGTGRVGSAMAIDLKERGYNVEAVYDIDEPRSRHVAMKAGARAASGEADAARNATVIFVTTQDSHIRHACGRASTTAGDMMLKTFMHMSGSLPLNALEPAEKKGALLGSVHPIQTFADARAAAHDLPGATFSVTARAGAYYFASALVEELGGTPKPLADKDKALYHSAAVMAGNLTTMLFGAVADIYRSIGFENREAVEAALPLARTSLANAEKLGPAGALTGPLARGDIPTLKANLDALDEVFPEVARAYRAVSLMGLRLVIEQGEVDDATIAGMKAFLEEGLSGSREETG